MAAPCSPSRGPWGYMSLAAIAFCLPHMAPAREAGATCNRLCKDIITYQICSNFNMYGQYRYGDCGSCPNTKSSLCDDATDKKCEEYSSWLFHQAHRFVDPTDVVCDCVPGDNSVISTEIKNAKDGGTWTDGKWYVCQGKQS